jgi:hypothetical protein
MVSKTQKKRDQETKLRGIRKPRKSQQQLKMDEPKSGAGGCIMTDTPGCSSVSHGQISLKGKQAEGRGDRVREKWQN